MTSQTFVKKSIIFVLVAVLFYAILVVYSDFNAFTENLQKVKIEYIPAILFFTFLGILIKGFRQSILLKVVGVKISLKENFLLYFAGLSMIVTPFGSGELIKSYFLKKQKNYEISRTSPVVLSERFHDFLAIITMIGITLLVFNSIPAKALFIFGIIFVIFILIVIRKKGLFELILTKFLKMKFMKKFTGSILESHESIKKLAKNKILFKAFILSLLGITSDAIAVYLSFLAMDIQLNVLLTSQIYFVSSLIGILTLLPAGIIVTESSMISLLVSEGIQLSIASVLVLLIRLTTIWFATAIGFISIKKQHIV